MLAIGPVSPRRVTDFGTPGVPDGSGAHEPQQRSAAQAEHPVTMMRAASTSSQEYPAGRTVPASPHDGLDDGTATPISWDLGGTWRSANGIDGGTPAGVSSAFPSSSERLAASFELMQTLLDGAELADVLTLVVTRARSMATAELAGIALPRPDTNSLGIEVTDGLDADRVRGLTVHKGRSLIGRAFSSRQALSSRITTDPVLNGLPAGPALLLPMDSGTATRGVLILIGRAGAFSFSPFVARQLFLFATTCATLIDIAEERRVQRAH